MTRSEPPQGAQPTGQDASPYPSGQYPPPTYPAASGQTGGVAPSRNEYGQPFGTDAPTIALPTGPTDDQRPFAEVGAPQQHTSVKPNHRPTRIGAAWVALIVAAIVLIFLLIFIVQNSGPVQIRYFGFEGTVPLGVAMLFAAVAGALTAALLGTVRILQMRKKSRQGPAGKQ